LPSARAVPNWVVVPVTWLTAMCSMPRKPTAFTMPAIPAREIAPTQTQRGSRVFMRCGAAPVASGGVLQAHAAAAAVAGLVFADQLDPGGAECADDLGERVDHAAHGAFAGFHALVGGQGAAGQLGQAALVAAKQGAGGPHLGRSEERRVGKDGSMC